eukprot:NODE_2403_length_1208_cov_30.729940_g2191_i0.p1 GENE.NODE_2403_length_1208_cov_30.729940_g2191_i0~~NODE_2403_length_1208_cov_30.729940_g2191_i0.p1  ORF type:complete len:354 (-),score=43.73 NODE_2403_length_1208_cov_30.729940_g2191_i0:78-1139(-)
MSRPVPPTTSTTFFDTAPWLPSGDDACTHLPNGMVRYLDGSVRLPDGSFRLPDGQLRWPNGNMVRPGSDGNVPLSNPGEYLRLRDGAILYPGGTALYVDGTVRPANWRPTVENPMGYAQFEPIGARPSRSQKQAPCDALLEHLPPGSYRNPQGIYMLPNRMMWNPSTRQVRMPEGSILDARDVLKHPKGTVVARRPEDGSRPLSDGTLFYPDGHLRSPTGDWTFPDGVVQHADGRLTWPDGSMVPAGQQYRSAPLAILPNRTFIPKPTPTTTTKPQSNSLPANTSSVVQPVPKKEKKGFPCCCCNKKDTTAAGNSTKPPPPPPQQQQQHGKKKKKFPCCCCAAKDDAAPALQA